MRQGTLPVDIPSLFETLTRTETLELAFKAVRKNKGAPGIDGVTIKAFERHLDEELAQLKEELEDWRYKPSPVRHVVVPKASGGTRKLGIPCVRDRVVQTGLKLLLEPILDRQFSESSYGFRPNRSPQEAVEAARKIVASGKGYVVDIDLSNFFDRINHDRLIGRLGRTIQDKRILRLIGLTLRSGISGSSGSEEGIGSPQGSPLSPLLSNVVLDELDKELERRGLAFCRYADDCNIFVKSQKAAQRVMQSVSKYIEKVLKLLVNREKSQVAPTERVKFLGLTLIKATIAISRKAMGQAMERVKALTPRGTSQKLEQAVKEINRWYQGWSEYFSMTNYPAQLRKIEAHIRRRLRSRLISQQKRRRYLYNTLVKRGVEPSAAKRTVYSHRKRWALSRTIAVSRAFPNKWFEETLGLKTRSGEKRAHWFSIKQWVKLT